MSTRTSERANSSEEQREDKGFLSLWNKWGEQDLVTQYDSNPELRKEMAENIQAQIDKDIVERVDTWLKTFSFAELMKENMRDEFYYGKYDTRLSPEDV